MTPTPPPETPAAFGPALRAAREQAGRSVEQVCAATRLRPPVVQGLERGDVAPSGGSVYARGHVRTIAGALGVDPAPLLAALDREQAEHEQQADEPPERPAAALPGPQPPLPLRAGALGSAAAAPAERRGPDWGTALVAAVALLVVLLGIGVWSGGERAPDEVPLAQRPAEPTASPAPPRPVPSDATAEVPDDGARLRVRAVDGASWVRVQGSRQVLFEGTFREGEPPKDFRDPRSLRVLVGNAAAVSVVCGGKDLAPSDDVGQVRRFTCRGDGLDEG